MSAHPATEAHSRIEPLVEYYRRIGHDAGYHQAIKDQLDGLVLSAERFLTARGNTPDDRKLLYAFVAELHESLRGQSPYGGGALIDGLGI